MQPYIKYMQYATFCQKYEMGEKLQLKIKLLTGRIEEIEIFETSSVLQLKELIQTKVKEAATHRQKLIADFKGAGTGTTLDDEQYLSNYPNIKNNAILFLVMQPAYILYIQDQAEKVHEIEIPSKEPENFRLTELRALVEAQTGQSLDGFQFQLDGKPLIEISNGKQLVFKDYNIKKEDHIFILKTGHILDIIKPQVDLCFLVDCTGSMGSWIESVKDNIKTVRDQLDEKYKGCDLQFAFVRYTDYDQPEETRTTKIDLTKSLTAFHGFVKAIGANGGGDTAEDIMGGLKCVFEKLSWRQTAVKVLIHIADAPCHGSMYHDGVNDSYTGGDKYGITHDQMMKQLVCLDIKYCFGYISKQTTDKMIKVFNESVQQLSNQKMIISQFDATDCKEIADAVNKSITAGVFAAELKKK